MGKAGRPAKGLVRLVAHVPLRLAQAVKEEAKTREMTIGELVQEAFEAFEERIFVIKHAGASSTTTGEGGQSR